MIFFCLCGNRVGQRMKANQRLGHDNCRAFREKERAKSLMSSSSSNESECCVCAEDLSARQTLGCTKIRVLLVSECTLSSLSRWWRLLASGAEHTHTTSSSKRAAKTNKRRKLFEMLRKHNESTKQATSERMNERERK